MRRPEADRPTFLHAEAPIIGAAQALLASPNAVEQTPEELYWGAFYLSRVLTQNLRWLSTESGVALGAVRIRRVEDGEGGEDLEVYGRGRHDDLRRARRAWRRSCEGARDTRRRRGVG